MFYEKVKINDNTVYGFLIKLAEKKGIDIYEVDGPNEINGLFYNLENEGINAKFILVNTDWNKEFTLAYLLEYIRIKGTKRGHIMLKEKKNKEIAEFKAERCARRVISLLERWHNQ